MLPAARHDVLVIADSDVHAAPDYLRPRGRRRWSGRASGWSRRSIPGCRRSRTLAARLGRQRHHARLPARRAARPRAGPAGLPRRHDGAAARDAGCGRRLRRRSSPSRRRRGARAAGARARGWRCALADTVPATTVPRPMLAGAAAPRAALGADHPRAGAGRRSPARRRAVPAGLVACWRCVLAGGAAWAWRCSCCAWGWRAAAAARGIDAALGQCRRRRRSGCCRCASLSVGVLLASYAGRPGGLARRRCCASPRRRRARSREDRCRDEDPVPAAALLRRLRRRRRLALSGAAGNPLVLVSDLARPAGRAGARQPADRRAAGAASGWTPCSPRRASTSCA